MEDNIKCVYEVENDHFDIISDYLNNLSEKELSELSVLNNYLIYFNDEYFTNTNEYFITFNKLPFLFDKNIIPKFQNCVDFLNSKFKIKRMWAMVYPPKTYINFHKDYGQKRHIISFNENELFFNYESISLFVNDKMDFYTENLKIFFNEPQKFNELFLNDDVNNKIINLEKNKIYTFGDTVHSFFNASTDKHRFNIVFEVLD